MCGRCSGIGIVMAHEGYLEDLQIGVPSWGPEI